MRFAVSGAGRIAAVDNGNPASLEPFQSNRRKAFSGLALLVVRTKRGEPGTIRVRAESDGIAAAEAGRVAGSLVARPDGVLGMTGQGLPG